MPEHFNELTAAQDERLAVLIEECGEVLQVIGKIQRHGYASWNPDDPTRKTNRQWLEEEMGHLYAALAAMLDAEDFSWPEMAKSRDAKRMSIGRWLHHQDGA